MKTRIAAVLLLAQLLASSPVLAEPPARPWNVTLSESAFSQYIWRGIRQRPNAAAVLQSNLSANRKRWTFSAWSSMELTGRNDATFNAGDRQQNRITEGDDTVDYAWAKGKYKFNSGLIYYRFPNSPYLSTQELYQTVIFPGRLAPTVTLYQDIDECRGQYATLGLTHAKGPWTLSGQVGYATRKYNNFWFGVDKDGLANSIVQLAYAHKLNKTWTLTPTLAVTSILDKDLRKSGLLSGEPDNVWGGLTFSRSF